MAVSLQDILNHQALVIEYRAYCSYLIRTLKNEQQLSSNTHEMLSLAAEQARKLIEIFTCLNEQQEIIRHKKHQEIFRKLLRPAYIKREIPTEGQFVSEFNNKFIDMNTLRFGIVRALRTLRSFTLLAPNTAFSDAFFSLNNVLGPVFGHLGWMYFATRLSLNLSLLFKHTIPHPEMPVKEKNLDPAVRFLSHIYFNRRWFFLINDLIWFVGCLVSSFVLTSTLLPLSIYLAIGLQCFDFLFASVRYAFEKNQFNHLKNNPLSEDPLYLTALDEHIHHAQFPNTLLVINHACLLLAILMFLPAVMSISPFLPIFGGCLSVITTAVNYHQGSKLRQNLPDCDVRQLATFGLFKDQPTSPTKAEKRHGVKTRSSEPEFSVF